TAMMTNSISISARGPSSPSADWVAARAVVVTMQAERRHAPADAAQPAILTLFRAVLTWPRKNGEAHSARAGALCSRRPDRGGPLGPPAQRPAAARGPALCRRKRPAARR